MADSPGCFSKDQEHRPWNTVFCQQFLCTAADLVALKPPLPTPSLPSSIKRSQGLLGISTVMGNPAFSENHLCKYTPQILIRLYCPQRPDSIQIEQTDFTNFWIHSLSDQCTLSINCKQDILLSAWRSDLQRNIESANRTVFVGPG